MAKNYFFFLFTSFATLLLSPLRGTIYLMHPLTLKLGCDQLGPNVCQWHSANKANQWTVEGGGGYGTFIIFLMAFE